MNYISQNSLSYVFPVTMRRREILLQDLEGVNERATILQFTTQFSSWACSCPNVPGSSSSFSDSLGKCVSQTSRWSILVLASAGPPHCQLDATVPDMKLIFVNSANASGSSLFLFLPTLPPSSLLDSLWSVGLKVPPQMWRIKRLLRHTSPHNQMRSVPCNKSISLSLFFWYD